MKLSQLKNCASVRYIRLVSLSVFTFLWLLLMLHCVDNFQSFVNFTLFFTQFYCLCFVGSSCCCLPFAARALTENAANASIVSQRFASSERILSGAAQQMSLLLLLLPLHDGVALHAWQKLSRPRLKTVLANCHNLNNLTLSGCRKIYFTSSSDFK